MRGILLLLTLGVVLGPAPAATLRAASPPGVGFVAEFIEPAPQQPEVHASTLVETASGVLVAAWFAGSKEGNDDVTIWSARRTPQGWSAAREIARGVAADGTPLPCYNPVLFRGAAGRITLVYSVGREGAPWTPLMRWSGDDGATWSAPAPLPSGMRGPDRNRPITLASGELMHPSTSSGRKVHVELSASDLSAWRRQPVVADPNRLEAIQPTLLDHGGGRVQMLCRTYARDLATAWSSDGGRTWTPLAALEVTLANSAIDATRLRDGRFLLVYNPSARAADRKQWGERVPLSVAVSTDGVNWRRALDLETARIRDGYAYPCVLQTADGQVHLTYTWGRKRIRHVVLDPRAL